MRGRPFRCKEISASSTHHIESYDQLRNNLYVIQTKVAFSKLIQSFDLVL